MATRLEIINPQELREAMDLEICSRVDEGVIEKYIAYQKALDDFCNGTVPPRVLIDILTSDGLIQAEEYLNNLSENLKCL